MATMDVFQGRRLLDDVAARGDQERRSPSRISSARLNIFQDAPQRTRTIAIESVDETLSLIQTSQVGAPPSQLSALKRKVRNFSTVRLAKESTIKAEELQGIRAFGSETELRGGAGRSRQAASAGSGTTWS
jgi:hypothetical protein